MRAPRSAPIQPGKITYRCVCTLSGYGGYCAAAGLAGLDVGVVLDLVEDVFTSASCSTGLHSTLSATYNYQAIPVLSSATIQQDSTMRIPEIHKDEDEIGKRGKKPDTKPRQKRKSPKPEIS